LRNRKGGTHLLDIIVRQGTAILELLAGEDEALLIGGNALFVLDLGLDVVDCVAGFDFEGYGLAGEGLDEAGRGRVSGVRMSAEGSDGGKGGRMGCEEEGRSVGGESGRGLHLHYWRKRTLV
jgi:hypothetical protein